MLPSVSSPTSFCPVWIDHKSVEICDRCGYAAIPPLLERRV
jgi:hypothetical protein